MAFSIAHGISGDSQMNNFMNATQQTIGDLSVSIAVRLPSGLPAMSEDQIAKFLKGHFQSLSRDGFEIEIQTGPDQEMDEDDEEFD